MNADCIFCRIIRGEAPGKIVYRDDRATAFHDNRPVAPVHILVVPNQHIASANELTAADEPLIGHLVTVAGQLAEQHGIAEAGFRLILNTGPNAGQTVYHLHLHLLGGQRMRFPMG